MHSLRWNGGRVIRDGYLYVYYPEHPNSTKVGQFLYHRLIMELKLGRLLERKEVVHHKDHNKLNNHISNLVLAKNQAEHNKLHKRSRDVKGRFIGGE